MAQTPLFCETGRIGTLFYPDAADISAQADAAGLPPAPEDRIKTRLLIVDMQIDFCHSNGALYVPGAQDDLQRLIHFIHQQAERITDIICSLDSHLPQQIFHPAWWVDREGKHPPPFTVITHEDVLSGKWLPLQEREWSLYYTRKLREQSSKELTVWPYHCLIGSIGQALDPELFSTVFWHALARHTQPLWWTKGSVPGTEHYSIVQPEIPVPGHPQGSKSAEFIKLIDSSDYVIIAGEAETHCVLETLEDLVTEFEDRPEKLRRLIVLEDCTSPIRHPEIDYEAITHKRFAEFAEKGVQFCKSTGPLPFET